MCWRVDKRQTLIRVYWILAAKLEVHSDQPGLALLSLNLSQSKLFASFHPLLEPHQAHGQNNTAISTVVSSSVLASEVWK